MGVEPTTFALQKRCSTNWAISANMVDIGGFEPPTFPIWTGCSNQTELYVQCYFGADDRTRTYNILITKQTLYQLELHQQIWWIQQGLNLWPFDYRSNALPTELCIRGTPNWTWTSDQQLIGLLLYQLSYESIIGAFNKNRTCISRLSVGCSTVELWKHILWWI